MQYLESGDSKVAYVHKTLPGRKDRPIIMFVHALATNSGIWDQIVDHFAPIADTLTFDLPGHGSSVRGHSQSFAFEDLASVAATLLNHLEIARVHLVGVSVGGEVAQAFAASHPDRMDRMVLSSTACHTSPERAVVWSQRINDVEQVGMVGIADATAARWFSKRFCVDHPAVVRSMASAIGQTDVVAYTRLASVIARMDLRSSNRAIRSPTLIVHGAEDHNTGGGAAEVIASTITRARITSMPDCGHFPHLEKQADWLRIVQNFLFKTASEGPCCSSGTVRSGAV